ncbi:hypothetical protein KX00_2287 [Francisella sp. TX07-6608]|nr:hypothetical protein KX00_2287 [Francisella sp. TX07-6608]
MLYLISNIKEIFYNLIKGFLRKGPIKFKKSYHGILEKFTSREPIYNVFKQWEIMKSDLKIPSTFYLSTIQTVKKDINDGFVS